MLSIDIETYSSRDLAKCGVYAYSEDFALLLFSYSLDNSPVKCVDIAHGEKIDGAILDMLVDENVIKSAFNVNFERICLSAYFRQHYPERLKGRQFLSPRGWRCSMVWSASLGLPRTLAEVAQQLHLDCQKMAEGKELIKKFCTEGIKNVEKCDWELFKKYNIRDVEVEMAITRGLSPFPLWEEFYLDQEINDRGVGVDRQLVKNAIKADEQNREAMMARMQELTGLDNPNSVVQLKDWLAQRGIVVASLDKKTVAELLEKELSANGEVAPLCGEVASASEAEGELVSPLEGNCAKSDKPLPTRGYTGDKKTVREVLELRQKLAKSSVKKYRAIENAMCADGRVRGMFRFYGASRSGRFSSKIINLQNLPRGHVGNLEDAREALKRGEPTDPDTLSGLIRTAFIPTTESLRPQVRPHETGLNVTSRSLPEATQMAQTESLRPQVRPHETGLNVTSRSLPEATQMAQTESKFIVADFSSIEARVVAWLSGEEWVLEAFRRGQDIYCATASKMYGIPVEKGNPLRQKGKAATLACSYGGSVGALKAISGAGAHSASPLEGNRAECDKPLPTSRYTDGGEMVRGNSAFISDNDIELKAIVDAWRRANPHIVALWQKLEDAVFGAIRHPNTTEPAGRLSVKCESGILFITLPSGRRLAYRHPRIEEGRWGYDALTYDGYDVAHKWGRVESFGGKLVENCTQAIARDILMHAMEELDHAGFSIVAHVHDEIILEGGTINKVIETMTRVPDWAEGLPLSAQGFETAFYRKE